MRSSLMHHTSGPQRALSLTLMSQVVSYQYSDSTGHTVVYFDHGHAAGTGALPLAESIVLARNGWSLQP